MAVTVGLSHHISVYCALIGDLSELILSASPHRHWLCAGWWCMYVWPILSPAVYVAHDRGIWESLSKNFLLFVCVIILWYSGTGVFIN